jgi:hypothetical protein
MFSRPWPLNDVIFVVFHREIYFFLFVRACFCNGFFLFLFLLKKLIIIYCKFIFHDVYAIFF